LNSNTERGTEIGALRHPSAPVAIGETAAAAQAAQSKAVVLARYEMAIRQPRDWDSVRQALLKECRRPSFAHNKSALYKKPIGEGVEGLGIRFVEVGLRCMKNVLVTSSIVFEDENMEAHKVSVTDLEANTGYDLDVKVSKSVERSKPMSDGSYLSVRKNSWGKDVYTVPATDDDLLNKRAALISKAVRTLGLRLIPGDLQDEAEELIRKIRKDDAAKDPDAAKKAIVDAFGDVSVSVDMLTEYLGHPLDEITAQEIVDLRGFYGAIKDGEATWHKIMEHRQEDPNWKPKRKEHVKTAEELKAGAGGAEKSDAAAGSASAGAAQKAQERPVAQAPAAAAPDANPDTTIHGPKMRRVVTERGRVLTELAYEPKLSEIIDVDNVPWRVIEFTTDQVVVRPADRPAAKPPEPGQQQAPAAKKVVEATPLELQAVVTEIMGATTTEDLKQAEDLIDRLPEAERPAAKALLDTKRKGIGATETASGAHGMSETAKGVVPDTDRQAAAEEQVAKAIAALREQMPENFILIIDDGKDVVTRGMFSLNSAQRMLKSAIETVSDQYAYNVAAALVRK
jgi:hypothetical protein